MSTHSMENIDWARVIPVPSLLQSAIPSREAKERGDREKCPFKYSSPFLSGTDSDRMNERTRDLPVHKEKELRSQCDAAPPLARSEIPIHTGLHWKALPRLREIGWKKVVFCLPTAGRRTQFFHPIFTQFFRGSLYRAKSVWANFMFNMTWTITVLLMIIRCSTSW